MASARPKLAQQLYARVTINGWYESDIFNHFQSSGRNWSRREIEKALSWLRERGHLRRCGDAVRPLYVRPERRIVYDNIRPVSGTPTLLTMHSNFEEKPR